MRLGRLALLLLLIFFTLSVMVLAGSNDVQSTSSVRFIDRDGDGFDDNVADQDGNGIPDVAPRGQAAAMADSSQSQSSMFAAAASMLQAMPVFLHNSGSFNHLKLQLSPLTQHRGNFGAGVDFGPGGDIGCGAVLGGACAGGACRP